MHPLPVLRIFRGWLSRIDPVSAGVSLGKASIALPLVLFMVSHAALGAGVAVKRGQQKVDPGILPLLCIAVATDDAALPLDTITFENLEEQKNYKFTLSGSFSASHPDMLTAVAHGNSSLSLPIVRLKPGTYLITQLEFLGAPVSGQTSNITYNLAQGIRLTFKVAAGCVNYAGTLVISADWAAARLPKSDAMYNKGVPHRNFASQTHIEQTAQRDFKWASDVIPGMKTLPSVAAPIEVNK